MAAQAKPVSDAAQKILGVAASLGLTVTSVFVPFSQSRNKAEKHRSLNWRVTLHRNGREILTTDYSAGEGHCPSYKRNARQTVDYRTAIAHETEYGRTASTYSTLPRPVSTGPVLSPETASVLYSIASDSDVLNSIGFEEWARGFGYDTDSRKAESIYRACMAIALKLHNGIGEDGLAALREACQNY